MKCFVIWFVIVILYLFLLANMLMIGKTFIAFEEWNTKACGCCFYSCLVMIGWLKVLLILVSLPMLADTFWLFWLLARKECLKSEISFSFMWCCLGCSVMMFLYILIVISCALLINFYAWGKLELMIALMK